MSQIIKEYLFLIIIAVIAIIVLIWYSRKQITDAAKYAGEKIDNYKKDVEIVTNPGSWKDVFANLFSTQKYISAEDQRRAISEINKKLGIGI